MFLLSVTLTLNWDKDDRDGHVHVTVPKVWRVQDLMSWLSTSLMLPPEAMSFRGRADIPGTMALLEYLQSPEGRYSNSCRVELLQRICDNVTHAVTFWQECEDVRRVCLQI